MSFCFSYACTCPAACVCECECVWERECVRVCVYFILCWLLFAALRMFICIIFACLTSLSLSLCHKLYMHLSVAGCLVFHQLHNVCPKTRFPSSNHIPAAKAEFNGLTIILGVIYEKWAEGFQFNWRCEICYTCNFVCLYKDLCKNSTALKSMLCVCVGVNCYFALPKETVYLIFYLT